LKARVCPQCGSHNPTDSWRCEACGGSLSITDLQEVDATTPEPEDLQQAPMDEIQPEPLTAAPEPSLAPSYREAELANPLPLGPRIAGGVLIINALFVLAALALGMQSALNVSPFVPALIDILVGIYLIRGSWSILPWAKARVILGGVVYGLIAAVDGDFISMGATIAFSVSLLLLLYGKPKRIRISVSLVVIALVFLLDLFGFQQALTGTSFLGQAINRLAYKASPSKDPVFQGTLVDYTIGPLDSAWMRRDDAAAKNDNPKADLWLVHPAYDAHIIVVPDIAPAAGVLDLETYTDLVIELTSAGFDDFVVITWAPLTQGRTPGNVVEMTGESEGLDLRFRIGLFVEGNYYVEIACFSLEAVFYRIEDSCDTAFRTFRFGMDE
jgi:hypothetical protein